MGPMISMRRYGYRMIGQPLFGGPVLAPTVAPAGELSAPATPYDAGGGGGIFPALPSLSTGLVLSPAPVAPAVVANPACPTCPACPPAPVCAPASSGNGKAALAFAGGGLLMYLVGLLTREMGKKRRRRR